MKRAAAIAMLFSFGAIVGCASDTPPPTPSNKEVRTDADRSFDRMKQEEREHGKGMH